MHMHIRCTGSVNQAGQSLRRVIALALREAHLLCGLWCATDRAAGEDMPAGSFFPAPAAAEGAQTLALPCALFLFQEFRQVV